MNSTILIAAKELKAAVRTPRFLLVCIITLPLFVGSVWLGAFEFEGEQKSYGATLAQEAESYKSIKSYFRLLRSFLAAYRPPNPRALLAEGAAHELSNTFFTYNVNNPPDLKTPLTSNSFSKLHGEWDLVKVISLVLSFLALMLSYDALSAEKAAGTIRQLCAYPISRSSIAVGKVLGLSLTMAVPIIPAALLSVLVLQFVIPEYAPAMLPELLGISLLALLLTTVFVIIGVAISALSHQPFLSLASCLLAWISLVFAVPQVGAMFASNSYPLPDEKTTTARGREITDKYIRAFRGAPAESPLERQKIWFRATKVFQHDLQSFWRELSGRLARQEETAWLWSAASPVFALNMAAAGLCGTNPGAEISATEDAWLAVHRFVDYLESKFLPDLEEAYKTGQQLRQYEGGIPWDEVPKVTFRGVEPARRWNAMLLGAAQQAVWMAAFLAVAIVLVRRYDAR